jgi:Predicted transcriptional regulator
MSISILRLSEVKARVGLSRSTIYLKIKEGSFPSPIKLGPRASGWLEREIDEWIAQQAKKSRNAFGATSQPPSGLDGIRALYVEEG